MRVVPFIQDHLKFLEVKGIHAGEVPQTVMTEAVTFLDGEKPVAIFGAFFLVPGVVYFWGLVSDDVKKKPLAFHKLARTLLNYYEKKQKVRRIQIDVKADFIEGQKWAKLLDFEYEGTMKRFGVNGDDFHLYARVS